MSQSLRNSKGSVMWRRWRKVFYLFSFFFFFFFHSISLRAKIPCQRPGLLSFFLSAQVYVWECTIHQNALISGNCYRSWDGDDDDGKKSGIIKFRLEGLKEFLTYWEPRRVSKLMECVAVRHFQLVPTIVFHSKIRPLQININ